MSPWPDISDDKKVTVLFKTHLLNDVAYGTALKSFISFLLQLFLLASIVTSISSVQTYRKLRILLADIFQALTHK